MKISRDTRNVLKNFSSINPNLVVKKGNLISTKVKENDIVGEAEVPEVFDVPFSIWDLPQFLQIVNLFNDPEFDFKERYVEISEGGSVVSYTYAAMEGVPLIFPKGLVRFPEEIVVSLNITASQLVEIIKVSAVLELPDFFLRSDGKTVSVALGNKKNPSTNSYSVELSKGNGFVYELVVPVNNLKMIPLDYKLDVARTVSSAKKKTIFMARFSNEAMEMGGDALIRSRLKLRYYIGFGVESTFSE